VGPIMLSATKHIHGVLNSPQSTFMVTLYSRSTRALTFQSFFNYLEDEHGPHHDKHHKVHPIPEPHGVLDEVCYIGPPIQSDDLQDRQCQKRPSNVKRDLVRRQKRPIKDDIPGRLS